MTRGSAALAQLGRQHGATRGGFTRGDLARSGFSNGVGAAQLGFHAVHECDRHRRRLLGSSFQRRKCQLGSLLLGKIRGWASPGIPLDIILVDTILLDGVPLDSVLLDSVPLGVVLRSARFERALLGGFVLVSAERQGGRVIVSIRRRSLLLGELVVRRPFVASHGHGLRLGAFRGSVLRASVLRASVLRASVLRGNRASIVGFLLGCPAGYDAREPRRPDWNGAIGESSRNDLALRSGSDRLYIVERSTDGRDTRGQDASIVFGRGGFGCPVCTVQGFHVATLPV